jgi:hypothetical protein
MPDLLWDKGPGEIRAALVDADRLVAFRIIRLVGGATGMAPGTVYTGRITQKMASRKALITVGVGEDGLLSPCPDVPEGALISVQMVRPPLPEPGRWKRAKFSPVDAPALAQLGRHPGSEPWVKAVKQMAMDVEAIRCADPTTANELAAVLGSDAPPILVDPAAIDDADFDLLIEQAVSGEFPIPGGMLSIERTRAMTMIDIDGTGDALTVNQAAATCIPELLRLLDIGGPIGIDFVSLASRAERQLIDNILAKTSAALGPNERTAINGFGFCQIIRPRHHPSVPEILCGTGIRQLSLESRAIALLRDLARSQGHGARHLVAPPAIIDLVRGWPDEISALQSQLGVSIELVPDSTATGYGHVHVDQR